MPQHLKPGKRGVLARHGKSHTTGIYFFVKVRANLQVLRKQLNTIQDWLCAIANIKSKFDVTKFLANIGEGRKIVRVRRKESIYAQGAPCDALFYIQKGKVRLTVVSEAGKEATIAVLNPTDFSARDASRARLCAWEALPP